MSAQDYGGEDRASGRVARLSSNLRPRCVAPRCAVCVGVGPLSFPATSGIALALAIFLHAFDQGQQTGVAVLGDLLQVAA